MSHRRCPGVGWRTGAATHLSHHTLHYLHRLQGAPCARLPDRWEASAPLVTGAQPPGSSAEAAERWSVHAGRSWASPEPTAEHTVKGELHFEIRKAGTLHGFTAWFSVRFQSLEEDEPQLVPSTGPFHPTTHWKQVLFMMDEPMSMVSGDVVTGLVVLQRNPVWRRHMSVALSFHTRPHIAESWREGLSHLEMTVEVVGSRCCRNEPGRRRAWM
ncbi:uncharacterized protein [Canis lupus baileyi]|uniref:uncharacterized protein LOC112664939 n=1 Tax=Canis lupus dingo TaxID=286419 RepID=UPI0015F19173|nr:uncharacterized protein LOC112664939 [Canis lupus dingo]